MSTANPNALVKASEAAAPAPKEPIEAGGQIAAIVPQNIEQAFRLAQALSRAGDMVPSHFQGSPDKIMGAIMRGAEVGLAPMQALSHIAVINGRATLWGDALPALMQRAGHHIDVEIEGEGDKAVAVATLTRGDTGKVIVRRFSMADAKRAGLAGKKGPWQDYPLRMLAHRARSWAIRDGAADALMGLQVAEEVEDYRGPDHAKDVTPRRRSGGVSLLPVEDDGPHPYNNLPPEFRPERDEIIEAPTGNDAPAALPDELATVHARIMDDLERGEDIDATLEDFAMEIAAIRAASPGHGGMIDAAAEMART